MRERLNVSRQIQIREFMVGASLLGFWAIVLLSWPGNDVAVPLLIALVGGVTAVDLAGKVADHLMPGLPRQYRRPLKAAAAAVLVACAVAFVFGTLDHYLVWHFVEDGSQHHRIVAYMLFFASAGFGFLLWPPDPIAPPASLSQKLGFDDNPPLFGGG